MNGDPNRWRRPPSLGSTLRPLLAVLGAAIGIAALWSEAVGLGLVGVLLVLIGGRVGAPYKP